jgi:probable O-glycosylation ligase (exosortase A-associated)
MRDYVLTAVILGALPVCLIRPWIGIIVWYWFGLMNPHRMTWSFAYSMPFAVLIGGATLVGLLIAKDRKPIPWDTGLVLVAMLTAYFTFTTFFAWAPGDAWPQWEKIIKIILMTFVATMLIFGRDRIRVLMFTIALSIGFYGFKGGIYGLGGGFRVEGPEGSFMGGNTFIGLAFCMVLPVIICLAREERQRWFKWSLYVTAALTFVATIFTFSRGDYLALAVVTALLFIRAKNRLIAVAVLLPLLTIGPYLLPDRVYDRAGLIEHYQQDGSANARLQAWTVAWNVAKDFPLTGAGLQFEYAPDIARWSSYGNRDLQWSVRTSSAAHSIYFQILGQHGFVAFALFVLLLLTTLLRLQKIITAAQALPNTTWLAGYALALQTGFVGYMVAGAFLNSAYFDLVYLYIAMTAIFAREVRLAQTEAQAVVTPASKSELAGASPVQSGLGVR